MKQGTHLQLWYKSLDLNQKIDVMKDRIEQSKENIRCEKNLLHLRKTILRDLKDQKNLLHLKKVLKKHQAEKMPKYAMKKRMKNELCKRCRQVDFHRLFEEMTNQAFHRAHHRFLIDKAHLNIELREFGLAIGT